MEQPEAEAAYRLVCDLADDMPRSATGDCLLCGAENPEGFDGEPHEDDCLWHRAVRLVGRVPAQ
jgi:hypothetical protein